MTAPAKPFKCGMLRLVTETKIIWGCAVCDKEITAGTGYLTIDQAAVAEFIKAWDAYDAEMRRRSEAKWADLGVIDDDMTIMPKLKSVPWLAFHRACDPRPRTNDYWFDVGRTDTPRKFLHWVGHLHGKNWINATNLDYLAMFIGVDA